MGDESALHLNLEGNSKYCPASTELLERLITIKSLKKMTIINYYFPDIVLNRVRNDSQISELVLKDVHIESSTFIHVLTSCTNLVKLKICLSNAGSIKDILINGLKYSTNLKELDVTDNLLSKQDASALASVLKSYKKLETIKIIEGNCINKREAIGIFSRISAAEIK